MSPDGLIPDITTELEGDDLVISVVRAMFASRFQCSPLEIDHLVATNPAAANDFDCIMDEVAADPLDDSNTWVGLDAAHLCGPVRVFDVTGNPRQPDPVAAYIFCYAPAEGH